MIFSELYDGSQNSNSLCKTRGLISYSQVDKDVTSDLAREAKVVYGGSKFSLLGKSQELVVNCAESNFQPPSLPAVAAAVLW